MAVPFIWIVGTKKRYWRRARSPVGVLMTPAALFMNQPPFMGSPRCTSVNRFPEPSPPLPEVRSVASNVIAP